jgi:hypothetical protein
MKAVQTEIKAAYAEMKARAEAHHERFLALLDGLISYGEGKTTRGPTHQLPRNPAYHYWLRIHRDLFSLLGMVQLYPGYDCEQVYNCCQPYPGYDRCLRSNTSHCSLLKAIRPEWPLVSS